MVDVSDAKRMRLILIDIESYYDRFGLDFRFAVTIHDIQYLINGGAL